MAARQQFITGLNRLERLAQAAAAPSRKEAAQVSAVAEKARAQYEAAKLQRQAAARTAERLGWLPFWGGKARAEAQQAEAHFFDAHRHLKGLRLRLATAKSLIERAKASRQGAAKLRRMVTARKTEPAGDPSLLVIGAFLRRLAQTEAAEGSDAQRSAALVAACTELLQAAEQAHQLWDKPGAPLRAPQQGALGLFNKRDGAEQAYRAKPMRGNPTKGQMLLDLDGLGSHEEEPRIWLPVSPSRKHELLAKGAGLDRSAARRGSQFWIPVSERRKVEQFLPLAFRDRPTQFSFPPIRINAVNQNLHSIFDRDSWNHIRTTNYDRAGHRCQLCGKQGGSLWNRIATEEERQRGGLVDCHEVWDWVAPENPGEPGIQRLKRLLIVCKDCHMMFHEGFALSRARQVGLEDPAAAYLRDLRMLVNRCDGATLDAQLTGDREAWEANKSVTSWVLDFSHLATQDYMADKTLILQEGNKAGVTPAQVGGIAFMTSDGAAFGATSAQELVGGSPPRILSGGLGWSRI